MFSKGTDVYVGIYGLGIYKSADNGATWNAAISGISNLYAICSAALGSDLYVGTEAGFFSSIDDGANWDLKVEGMKASYITSLNYNGSVMAAVVDGCVHLVVYCVVSET